MVKAGSAHLQANLEGLAGEWVVEVELVFSTAAILCTLAIASSTHKHTQYDQLHGRDMIKESAALIQS